MSAPAVTVKREFASSAFLIVTGAIGWFASFMLTVERIRKLENPEYVPGCTVSDLIDCSPAMESWQGSLFGFPNPVLGVAAFMVPIVLGVVLLAGGGQLANWLWYGLGLGIFGGWVFSMWLFTEAVFGMRVLCPWCIVVWAMIIPLWWWIVARLIRKNAAEGSITRQLAGYWWLLVVINYAIILISIVTVFNF